MNDNNKTATITFTMQELQFVLNAIGQQPYVQAEPIIRNIVAQVNSQMQDNSTIEN